MPIYEYEALNPAHSCKKCLGRFETIQGVDEHPLSICPCCGHKVKKVISYCHAAIVEPAEEDLGVERKIGEYEKSGMWSHAAELADKYSEKRNDREMKTRALEDYKKAGHNADALAVDVKKKD